MRIQHNIMALNGHRNLMNNNSSVSKNLEKLSSGYRINRAGDDAAGLAISEKMRAQITGLQTAQKNAEDGVSLVQTAEGALTEVHSMLNRMKELATQASTGTYSTANREEMQKEIDALNEEIDRISNTANFNGTNLFGGDGTKVELVDVKIMSGKNRIDGTKVDGSKQSMTLKVNGASPKCTIDFKVEVTNQETGAKEEIHIKIENADKAVGLTDAELKDGLVKANKQLGKYGLEIDKLSTNAEMKITGKENGSGGGLLITAGTGATAGKVVKGQDAGMAYDLKQLQKDDVLIVGGKKFVAGTDFTDEASLKEALKGVGVAFTNNTDKWDKVQFKKDPGQPGRGTDVDLHVGESSASANAITVNIKAMSTKNLGIDAVDLSTSADAKKSIDIVEKAIDSVSSIRSDLGALQNRLEHTINNLGVQNENITAAESRIRDVDMAKEMMAYTKNNILVQASQAMLAQANQVPQGVLQLLQ